MDKERGNKLVTFFIGALVLAAFLIPIWHFLFQKDYFFVVETSCDPAIEICHYRDCSNEEDCPLGELEYFKRLRVHASEFETCVDNSCEQECTTGTLQCEEAQCDDTSDFECTLPEDFIAEEGTDSESEETEDSPVAE